jgi:hypothetical protein
MKSSSVWQAVAIGLLTVACGSSDPEVERRGGPLPPDPESNGGTGAVGGAVTWCAARAVLAAKCQRCHRDPTENGAPMALLTYEDTQAPWSSTQKVHDAMEKTVASDFMPYVELNEPPTSLTPKVEPLTASEKTTLLGWLEQGAKLEGGADCP